jgi:hypothetical protein
MRLCIYLCDQEHNNGVTVWACSPRWRDQKRKMNGYTEFWLTNLKRGAHVEGMGVGVQ